MKGIVFGLGSIVLLVLLAQCWQRQNNNTVVATDEGAKLYSEYCSRCHQLTGQGGVPTMKQGIDAPDIREATKSQQQLVAFISNGWGNMPSFKDSMSDESIAIIAQYVAAHIEKHPGTAPTSAQNQ